MCADIKIRLLCILPRLCMCRRRHIRAFAYLYVLNSYICMLYVVCMHASCLPKKQKKKTSSCTISTRIPHANVLMYICTCALHTHASCIVRISYTCGCILYKRNMCVNFIHTCTMCAFHAHVTTDGGDQT